MIIMTMMTQVDNLIVKRFTPVEGHEWRIGTHSVASLLCLAFNTCLIAAFFFHLELALAHTMNKSRTTTP